MLNLLLGCAAAHIKKIRRAAAGILNNVHRRHGQACAIHHAGNRAVQLDVIERVFAGFHFQRVFFGRVAQHLDLGVAKDRVVVEGNLRVQREELVVLCRDERIDLHQRGVGLDEGLVQALEESDRRVDLRGFQAESKGQLARLPCTQSDGRIDALLEDCLWSLRGHHFNLHAASLRGHEHQLARCPVQHNAQIKFAINGRRFFNQQPLHFLPLRAGLVRHQRHAENVLGIKLGLSARVRHLNTAALAAPSGMNLRLDDHARRALRKQFAGYCRGFFEVIGHFAPGHGYAVFRQDFLCLILVNLHIGRNRPVRCLGNSEPLSEGSGKPIPCQRYTNTILTAK